MVGGVRRREKRSRTGRHPQERVQIQDGQKDIGQDQAENKSMKSVDRHSQKKDQDPDTITQYSMHQRIRLKIHAVD